jgi:hypothetical protein
MSSYQLIILVLGLAGAFGIRFYCDRLDRARIREHVSRHGGRVLNIAWNPSRSGWPMTRYARFYDVRYTTRGGEIVTETCVTSASSGVHWLQDVPPRANEDQSSKRDNG